MKFGLRLLVAALGASAMTAAAVAQIVSPTVFSSQFDEDAPFELKGTVKRLEWGEPNVSIFLKVPDPESTRRGGPGYSVIRFSAGAPDRIARTGINLSNPASTITIRGYRGREACSWQTDNVLTCKAIARTVTAANGCTVFVGASGIGAPRDGLDPAEGGKLASCKPG